MKTLHNNSPSYKTMNDPTPPKLSLYDRHFTSTERQALLSTPCNDLSGEINLLKVRLARFLEEKPVSSEDRMAFMNTISLVAGHLASLVNTQFSECSPLSEIEQAREEGLYLARAELGILDVVEHPGEASPSEEESEVA